MLALSPLLGCQEVLCQTGANVKHSLALTPALAPAGSLAQVASAGGWDTTITLVNLGTTANSAHLAFTGNNGSALTLPFSEPQQSPLPTTTAATIDRTLAAGASYLLDTTGAATQPGAVGWAGLSTSGPVDGFAIFKYTPTNQQAVVPLETRNAASYLLPFDNIGTVGTGLAIANVAANAARVGVVVRDDTGAVIHTAVTSVPLAAGGHNSFMLTDATQGFPEIAGKRGTVEFDTPSGGQISVLGLRTNSGAVTTLPLLANVASGGGTFAHLAAGGGWQTTLTLVNAGNAATTVQLNFFDDHGAGLSLPFSLPLTNEFYTSATVSRTLPAGATLIVVTQSPAASAALTGSAQLVTSGNVGGAAIFRYNPSGQEAVVPLETRSPAAFVLAFDNMGGLATGLALTNRSAFAVLVPVAIRDDAGALITTATISLPALGHTSFMLTDVRLGYPQTAARRGAIEFDVPSGAHLAALGIRAQSQVITSVPALAAATVGNTGGGTGGNGGGLTPTTEAVAERVLAQTGLSIGMASIVLQSQLYILSAGRGSPAACTSTDGTSSYDSPALNVATVYYDANCTRQYIAANITNYVDLPSGGINMDETATYYGLGGTPMGSMTINLNGLIGTDNVELFGLGVFTPATGAGTKVHLGLHCYVNVNLVAGGTLTLPCIGAVEQDLPALGVAVGSVTSLSLVITQGSGGQTASTSFTGGGSTFSGPIGSISLQNPSPAQFIVQGGAAFGATTGSGTAAAFSLFPPTPTGWTISDIAHDLRLQITVLDNLTRSLSLTITQVSTSKVMVSGIIDQSGTGTIHYSDGSSATITNWAVAN